MDKNTLEFVKNETEKLLAAHSCCGELRSAAENYLKSIGTADEHKAAQAYIAELEEDVTPIDGLIAFAGSPVGAKVFGDNAFAVKASAEEAKAKGEKWCTCDACQAGARILSKKAELLK